MAKHKMRQDPPAPAYEAWDGIIAPVESRGVSKQPRPSERRARRQFVRKLLLTTALNRTDIAVQASEKFLVSVRSTWRDIRIISKEWIREDADWADAMRSSIMRRFERLYEACLKEGNIKQATIINAHMAKVLGLMDTTKQINVVNVHENKGQRRTSLLEHRGVRNALNEALKERDGD